MAMRSRPTIMKRQRERARQEKAKEKFTKRLERERAQGEARSAGSDGVDLDIADITPGPQPLADWQIDEEPEETEETSEDADAAAASGTEEATHKPA
jgi:hypothetical protein